MGLGWRLDVGGFRGIGTFCCDYELFLLGMNFSGCGNFVVTEVILRGYEFLQIASVGGLIILKCSSLFVN